MYKAGEISKLIKGEETHLEFEKERDLLYEKISMLKLESSTLDFELELKDELIYKYQFKLAEDVDRINEL